MRRVWKWAAIAAVATGAFATSMQAADHNGPPRAGTVTAVSVLRASGRAEVVIGFNGDVEVLDFALRAPHRIVVDLKGATLKMGPHAYDGIVRGGITNIHIAQNAPNIVRVVLDVDRERDYQIDRAAAEVHVFLETADTFEPWTVGAKSGVVMASTPASTPASAPAVTAPVTKPAAPAITPAVTAPIKAPATSPATSLATSATSSAKQPAIKTAAPPVAPPVTKPVAPPVTKPVAPPVTKPVAPPVTTPVTAPVVPPVTKVVEQPKPADLQAPVVPFNFSQPQQAGGRITISFRDTDLRDVLAVFAERSGRSIVTGLKGIPITAEIIDQPWQTALKEILDAYGLAAVISPQSGVIRVASLADLQSQRAAEQLSTARLALNFARADTLAKTLNSLLSTDCGAALQVVGGGSAAAANGGPPAPSGPASSQACAPRGKVTAEAPTNTLIITEIASRIDSLVAYAKSFDVKPQQVNIRAQIISINRTNTNQLGIAYDLGSTAASFNTLAPRSANGQATEFQVTLGGDAFAGVANATRPFANTAAINLLYSTLIGGSSMTSFLDALSQEGLTDIQSVPSVNTVDRKQAKLFAGSQIAFLITPPTAAGAIQSQPSVIQRIDVGVTLNVTPSISANRMIRLDIYAEQSALQSKDAAGPTISQRKVENEVVVRDGETAYISGLEQTQATKTRRGIPLLMNLPVIGRLFSQNESIEIKDDLLILITPHILDDPIPPPPGRQ